MMVLASASWLARIARLPMLVAGIVATPSVGMDAMQRPHCAQHELAVHRPHQATPSSRTGKGNDTQSWTQRHDHRCSHCPASECARLAPCAGSSVTAVAPPRAVAGNLDSHQVAVDLGRQHVHSASPPPDTPPPQLIA